MYHLCLAHGRPLCVVSFSVVSDLEDLSGVFSRLILFAFGLETSFFVHRYTVKPRNSKIPHPVAVPAAADFIRFDLAFDVYADR